MRSRLVVAVLVILTTLAWGSAAAAEPISDACWGQVTRAFAQSGMMGEHASSFDTPRLGLRNLARALHEAGVIDDGSMQALGAFVAEASGLSISACN